MVWPHAADMLTSRMSGSRRASETGSLRGSNVVWIDAMIKFEKMSNSFLVVNVVAHLAPQRASKSEQRMHTHWLSQSEAQIRASLLGALLPLLLRLIAGLLKWRLTELKGPQQATS